MPPTLPCDLSLIAIYISDRRHFSDIHISQGSVATCLRRGGVFEINLLQIYYRVPQRKKFENRLMFGEVTGKSLVSSFFDSRRMC